MLTALIISFLVVIFLKMWTRRPPTEIPALALAMVQEPEIEAEPEPEPTKPGSDPDPEPRPIFLVNWAEGVPVTFLSHRSKVWRSGRIVGRNPDTSEGLILRRRQKESFWRRDDEIRFK